MTAARDSEPSPRQPIESPVHSALMLSLAAIKYRHVLASEGGPIAKIVSSPVVVSGRSAIQANAFLTPGLAPRKPGMRSMADGAGLHRSVRIARAMAVSEALEHWAYLSVHSGPNARRYGFGEPASTAGMAAFPGLFKSQARHLARLEALEHFTTASWWERRCTGLPVESRHPSIRIVRLFPPWDFGEVVIVYRESRSGHVSYGRAAGSTLAEAIERAIKRLSESEFAITCLKLSLHNHSNLSLNERRCLHFASADGFREFLARVGAAPSSPSPRWQPIFDGELAGPWSRYTTVWRTALRMPSDAVLEPADNFFLW